MNLTKNETLNKILTWLCMGFVGAAGIGLWQLTARSVDFLNKLAWG